MDQDAALGQVCSELAEVKLRLRGLYVRWCVGGPTLEASSALAAMAQEESGHARILTRLAGSRHAASDLDRLMPIETITAWPELVGMVGPVESASVAVLLRIADSDNTPIVRNITKILAEERHHTQFFSGWFTELEQNHNAAGAIFARCREASEQRVNSWMDGISEILAEGGVHSLGRLPVEDQGRPDSGAGTWSVPLRSARP
jgi:1,2-phenylacetyl-CoA epoxidase catalytic subunit